MGNCRLKTGQVFVAGIVPPRARFNLLKDKSNLLITWGKPRSVASLLTSPKDQPRLESSLENFTSWQEIQDF